MKNKGKENINLTFEPEELAIIEKASAMEVRSRASFCKFASLLKAKEIANKQ